MGNIEDSAIEKQLTEDARKRAAADPLPGALSTAFLADAIKVNDQVSVRRVVATDWGILRGLKSPIVQQMLEMQKAADIREDVPFTDEEGCEICWQFTHNPAEVRQQFAKGRDEFRERAIAETADLFDATTIQQIVKAVGRQIVRSFETALKYGAADADEEVKKNNGGCGAGADGRIDGAD